MASTYLVAGTASHVGKSTVAAGLCRLLADRGVDVAPFKAQNMSNNARAVPRATTVTEMSDAVPGHDPAEPRDDAAFGEIGVSQYVQARAARVRPTTDCNPVLLKPRGDAESQLVLDGTAVGHYEAGNYYDEHWHRAREVAEAAHARLAAEHDAIVAEGAGAIAEPNLRERDLANVEAARFADADVLLVADLERGGAFASVVGTVELLPEDLRERIVGVLLNKFRGDASLLEPAIEVVEERVGAPVIGVLPYEDPGLPAEDSVDLPTRGKRAVRGDEAPAAAASTTGTATVAVPRLPRISNFTDIEPLAATPGLRVSYRPLDDEYADADAVVVPGTKNAVDDLLAARDAGLDEALAAFDGPIVGLCGGYQLLGERITNAAIEGTGDHEVVDGFGCLPVETAFEREKVVRQSRLALDGVGPLAGADGVVAGYEIHMGRTRATGDCATPFAIAGDERPGSTDEAPAEPGGCARRADRAGRADCARRADRAERADCARREGRTDRDGAALGAASGRVLGTYLHGLFENDAAREAFARAALRATGVDRSAVTVDRPSPYDCAAALLDDHADLGRVVPELR